MRTFWRVLKRFWDAIAATSLLVGILYLPSDVEGLPKALQDPYGLARGLARQVDRETALAWLALALIAWIVWRDARPYVWPRLLQMWTRARGERVAGPQLVCNIDEILWGGEIKWTGQSGFEPRDVVVLTVSVRNPGLVPSVALNWGAWVEVAGRTHLAEGYRPETDILMRTQGGKRHALNAADFLPDKTELTPVPVGGMMRGHMPLLFPKDSIGQNPGRAVLTVRCEDVWGRETRCQYTFGRLGGEKAYFPGGGLKSWEESGAGR